MFFSRVVSTDKNTQCTKPEIQQTFQIQLKDLQKIALRFKHKLQGFLLMLIEAIKPENFAHFPELIPRHF